MYEMGNHTLASLLEKRVESFSDKEAIVGYEQGDIINRLTYKELSQKALEVSKGLKSLGFEKGDHLIIWLPNINEWYIFEQACAKIGVVIIPVNTFLKANELAYILKQSDAKGIVYLKTFANIPYQQVLESLVPEAISNNIDQWQNNEFPALKYIISLSDDSLQGGISLTHLVEGGSGISDEEIQKITSSLDSEDLHLIMYTSGTTGAPKGCMLTHKNILDNAWYFSDALKITENDRYLIPVPYFHIGGLVLGLLSTLIRGGTIISLDRFDPGKALSILNKEKCTVLLGAPTIYITLLHHPDVKNYEYYLRMSFMAGAPCPIDVCKKVMETFNTELLTGLGQTETSPTISVTRSEDPLDMRVGSVGKPVGTEIRVVDPISLEDVQDGVPGELWVKGPNVMKGYYKMPDKTAESFHDGWFRTGDMVVKNENGYIIVAGRIKEMIIVGGENVYPREIEDYIRTHTKIKDVAYIGLPDKKYGEVGAAIIQLIDGEMMTAEEVIEYCHGNMASFKVPRYVQFVETYPLTPAGKIQKFLMVKQLTEELSLQNVAETGKSYS